MNITLTIDDPQFPITRQNLVELFKTMHQLSIRFAYGELKPETSSISMEPALFDECMKFSRLALGLQPEGPETKVLGIGLTADKNIKGIKFNIAV